MRTRTSHAARTRLAARLAALAALAASACGVREEVSAAPRTPRNVVLVCMDTVRADHLGCYGYAARDTTPALDALARESLLFRDVSAAACWTKPSVPSYLTGTFPLQHGVYDGSARDERGSRSDALPASSFTLAEAFHEAGYETAAFVRNAQLRAGLGFEQGFDRYVDQAGDARAIRWQGLDWIDERGGDAPFFLYLHLLDAHWPYQVPDEYASRFTPPGSTALFAQDDWRELRDAINDGELRLDDADLAALIALYDGSIRYIDDQLGLLLAGLERRGLREDTLVCVIADHGEEFLEHGRIGHGHGLYENLLQVPWILHIPGEPARAVDTPVSLVDLFPTLLHAAGVPSQARTAGVDRIAEPDLRRALFAEHKEKRAYEQTLRAGAAKLLRRFEPRDERDAPLPGDPLAALLPGTRWEARYFVDADGVAVATRLAPRDEPVDDPVELKGHVEGLNGGRFRLGGVAVRLAAGVELYGETHDDAERPLAVVEGAPVKAVGRFDGDVLVCTKLKLYEPEDVLEPALRGPLAEVGPDGAEVRIGPLLVALDLDTKVRAPERERPDLGREAVAALLAACASGAPLDGLARSSRLLDLAADPLERAPASPGARGAALERELDALVGDLLGATSWTSDDSAALSEEDLEALRAIGYAE